LHIARITAVEVISALARRHRKGDIDQADFDILVDRFEFDLHTQYQVVEISPALVHEAMMFSKKHGLRGYDAVQLAALFSVHQTLSREQLSLPTLIASDHDLLTAAIAEGFDVDDPNNY
jgi:predicted nucleic acid-binding protein